jgi:hypothetical protein
VHVRVDERREQVAPGAVDRLGIGACGDAARRADLGDLAVADEDVVQAIEARARIDDVRAAYSRSDGTNASSMRSFCIRSA